MTSVGYPITLSLFVMLRTLILLVVFHHIITSCYCIIICNIAVALNSLIIFHHIGTIFIITLLLIDNVVGTINVLVINCHITSAILVTVYLYYY